MKTQKLNLSVLIVAALDECTKMEYGPDTIANCSDTWTAFERFCNMHNKTFYEEQMAAEFLHNCLISRIIGQKAKWQVQ